MRKTCLSMMVLATMAVPMLMSSAAHADKYRWCAVYTGPSGEGGTNCGFVTYQQCLATISGVGGYCTPNQFYTGSRKRR